MHNGRWYKAREEGSCCRNIEVKYDEQPSHSDEKIPKSPPGCIFTLSILTDEWLIILLCMYEMKGIMKDICLHNTVDVLKTAQEI